ncbi:MAG TPA: hypothetical protein VGC99_16785 [Candidatus Tectomicrobia bacterium]
MLPVKAVPELQQAKCGREATIYWNKCRILDFLGLNVPKMPDVMAKVEARSIDTIPWLMSETVGAHGCPLLPAKL